MSFVIPASDLDIDSPAGIAGPSGGPFEVYCRRTTRVCRAGRRLLMEDCLQRCTICNVQINVAHPTALDTHMRAHKRNDELRDNMLEEYGQEVRILSLSEFSVS